MARKLGGLTEDRLHAQIADYLTIAIAPPGKSGLGGAMWFSVEHRNARSAAEGAARRRRGVVAGIPDLWVFHDFNTIAFELKRPGYSPSDVSVAQVEMHATLIGAMVRVYVCSNIGQVWHKLLEAGVPLKAQP